jgi:L-ribulose-5-phosphate 3-epimerase
MTSLTDRRSFLKQSAQITAGLVLMNVAGEQGWAKKPKPLFQISLAQWSLHNALFSKQLDNLDFAKVSKNDYGIEAIEYVNQFFKDKAKDQKYLGEMKKRAKDLPKTWA